MQIQLNGTNNGFVLFLFIFVRHIEANIANVRRTSICPSLMVFQSCSIFCSSVLRSKCFYIVFVSLIIILFFSLLYPRIFVYGFGYMYSIEMALQLIGETGNADEMRVP